MYINVTQTSPGRVKSSETTSVLLTAISCNARLMLVVYIQEYMPVETKLHRFLYDLSPFFNSICPFKG